jgi:phosphoribosyl 1,2-cyclic phosphodiesterase
MCCLASGSKGNCCFVSDGETNLLIDLGITAQRAEKCLAALGVDPDGVSVVVTHSHSDHIGGLKVFCKRHPSVRVHCQRESAGEIISRAGVIPTVDARAAEIGGLTVNAVPVPHDVPCFGYVVRNHTASVAVVTDVGTVTDGTLDALGGCGIVMIEANHEPDLLRANRRYSPMLKARIASYRGHLSNPDCAAACVGLAGRGVRNFILAHLSEDNNDPTLAVSEVCACLNKSGYFGVNVTAAEQDAMTGVYEVC